MRLHQRIEGDIGFIEQSIHCFYIFPGLCLRGPRGSAIPSHVSRGLHGSPRTAHVLELCLSKGRFGPLLRVQDFLRVQLSILPDCKMWVKDRPIGAGVLVPAPTLPTFPYDRGRQALVGSEQDFSADALRLR
jgi:hypothetical protein